MISDKCFTEAWLDSFKKQSAHQRIDKIILEKMIYALHLLERLRANGLDFVFKGLCTSIHNPFYVYCDVMYSCHFKAAQNQHIII